MKSRLLKRSLILLSALFLTIPLASCTAFFGDPNAGKAIDNITTSVDSNGNTIVTITFVDKEDDPVIFTIPKGQDGVGISKVETAVSPDGKSVILTIKYNDPKMKDTVVTIPVISGKDGNGITDLTVSTDEKGNITLVFTYSNGTKSPIITIPKGQDGKGIVSMVPSEPDEDGITTLVITYTDGTTTEIPLFTGKDGVGIESIEIDESNPDHYVLVITYTNGYVDRSVTFDRPKSTQWYSGNGEPWAPNINCKGNEGDYYVDKLNRALYQWVGGRWEFVFSLKDGDDSQPTYCTITFDPNGGKFSSGIELETRDLLSETTLALNRFPDNPTLEGYVFDGWFTDKTNINAGQFTDLTLVLSDLTVYARYVEA